VQLNPIVREELPTRPTEIVNRLNEISFNASLMAEMRAIAFVQKLITDGWIKDEFLPRLRNMLMHAIRADRDLGHLGIESKLDPSWDHLVDLRDRGRARAEEWLEQHFTALGQRSTVDIRADYL
jgi:NTE family protein